MNVNTIVNEPTDSIPEITSIVHDLRNPLTAIRIGAETIIASRFSEPRIHGIAANVYRASVHMQELLEELLTRYRWMDRGVQSTDLRDLVISAVRKIAFVAECQSVQIVQNVPERMMIAADRQRIQRVFVNLFVNALDVMPNGGAIRISAIS